MSEMNLTKRQYLTVLKRLRKKIAASTEKASGYDDTTVGCKHTHCNVGLCCDDPKVFTKPMNLFPDEYPARVSSKYRRDDHCCPLSGRSVSGGCFYTCLFFKHHLVDKGRILELYDNRIREVEKKGKISGRSIEVRVSIEAFGGAKVGVRTSGGRIRTFANGEGFQEWGIIDDKETWKVFFNGNDITTNYLEVASQVVLKYLGYNVKVSKTRPCERVIEVI